MLQGPVQRRVKLRSRPGHAVVGSAGCTAPNRSVAPPVITSCCSPPTPADMRPSAGSSLQVSTAGRRIDPCMRMTTSIGRLATGVSSPSPAAVRERSLVPLPPEISMAPCRPQPGCVRSSPAGSTSSCGITACRRTIPATICSPRWRRGSDCRPWPPTTSITPAVTMLIWPRCWRPSGGGAISTRPTAFDRRPTSGI